MLVTESTGTCFLARVARTIHGNVQRRSPASASCDPLPAAPISASVYLGTRAGAEVLAALAAERAARPAGLPVTEGATARTVVVQASRFRK